MKIAILSYSATRRAGGVETIMLRQARQLARAGHLVYVLAGSGRTWDPHVPVKVLPYLENRHPQVLKAKASLDKGVVPDKFEDLVFAIEKELSAALSGMDVIIAHNVASMHFNLPLTAALHRLTRLPKSPRLILWHHDLAWCIPRFAAELHSGYPWDLLRQPWEGARQVTVSEVRRQELVQLLDLPEKKIVVIPAGLDLPEFMGLQPRTVQLWHDLRLSLAEPILLTPVRINRRKNLELAIQTLAELRHEMPNAALIITGPTGANPSNVEYFEQLQKLRAKLKLEGAVHLLAEFVSRGLPEAVVADFFRISDALLLPSREEGFGNPVLEAGIAGLPIFCTDLPALRALGGGFATYFPPDASAKTVAWLIAKRLQTAAIYRLKVNLRREYTWESIYRRKLAKLLEKE